MYLGDQIKKLRLENKLTTRQFAEKLNVSHAHISKMEQDQNKPSIDLLEKMASVFNVHITYFFGNYEEQEIPTEHKEAGIDYIGIDKKYKKTLTEEDLRNILEFAKEVKSGKFDLKKLENVEFND